MLGNFRKKKLTISRTLEQFELSPDMLETFHRQKCWQNFFFVFQPTRRGVSRFMSIPYQRLFTKRGPTVHLFHRIFA